MKMHSEVFKKTPYIHRPGRLNEKTGKYEYDRPFVRIWQAITPTGRQSKHYHAESSKTDHGEGEPVYKLPKLPKGYTWTGPFSY